MAFKTFAPGVLTSSDVNTFLMRQSVITCTSSTRPASPNEGMTIYETDTNLFLFYTGTAWQSVGGYVTFTPTISSSSTGWAFGNAVLVGRYARIGNIIMGRMNITFGSTSTYGATDFRINVPVATANAFFQTVGGGGAFDASTGNAYGFDVNINSSGEIVFNLGATAATWTSFEQIDNLSPFTWTTSDQIGCSFMFEAA